MAENDKGFTVNDRRLFQSDGQPSPSETQETASASSDKAQKNHTDCACQQDCACQDELESGQYRNLPPVEFGSFIISLTHAAMMHLGHLEDHHGNKVERNLDLARHTIDTLAMLKDKTKGNLNEEEDALLNGILTELRMLFVQTCKSK